jgi:hypothetical protein
MSEQRNDLIVIYLLSSLHKSHLSTYNACHIPGDLRHDVGHSSTGSRLSPSKSFTEIQIILLHSRFLPMLLRTGNLEAAFLYFKVLHSGQSLDLKRSFETSRKTTTNENESVMKQEQRLEISIIIPLTRDSSVGIALGYGLDDRGSRVRFSVGAGNFSLHHRVQNGSGAHPASYPMGTRGSFPGNKVTGA